VFRASGRPIGQLPVSSRDDCFKGKGGSEVARIVKHIMPTGGGTYVCFERRLPFILSQARKKQIRLETTGSATVIRPTRAMPSGDRLLHGREVDLKAGLNDRDGERQVG